MGNLLNKEWTQPEDDLEEKENQQQIQPAAAAAQEPTIKNASPKAQQQELCPESKGKIIKRKLSNLINGNEHSGDYTRVGCGDSTPLSKVVIANFDPRSPTNGIVR